MTFSVVMLTRLVFSSVSPMKSLIEVVYKFPACCIMQPSFPTYYVVLSNVVQCNIVQVLCTLHVVHPFAFQKSPRSGVMRSPFQLRSSIDEDLCPCLIIWLLAATSFMHNYETVYLEVGNVLRDLFSKAMVCSSSSELILLQLVSFSAFFRDHQID